MTIKKILQLVSALVISLYSLLTISIPFANAATDTCTWTDASSTVGNLFSDSGNWNCTAGAVPDAIGGDTYNLVFPAAAGIDPVNDIQNLIVGNILFSGDLSTYVNGYDITSSGGANTNSVTVTGGISDTSTGQTNNIELGITATGDQTFNAGPNTNLILGDGTDNIDIGSSNVTLGNVALTSPITGSGSLIVNDSNYPADVSGVDFISSSPGFTGNVSVNQGALFVDDAGALSAASGVTVANGATLKGNGGVSSATVQSGGTIAPGHSPGCISANNMTINGTYAAQIGGTNACTDYDQLQVSGTVDISNSTLQLTLVDGFTPSVGQTFTIINNTGSNPVTGTFSNLASEGSTITINGNLFKVSYVGGDGNDVVLTVVSSATAAPGVVAPKAPATGLASLITNSATSLFVTSAIALSLILIARRLQQPRNN